MTVADIKRAIMSGDIEFYKGDSRIYCKDRDGDVISVFNLKRKEVHLKKKEEDLIDERR